MGFADIPVRGYTGITDPSWWNALRTAGIALESFPGAGYIVETPFAFANTQSTPADITGLIIDKTKYRLADIIIVAHRKTATNEVVSAIPLRAVYRDNAAAWDIIKGDDGPDDHGLTFSIDATTGQVKYTSDTMSGTGYDGSSHFKATTFSL